MCHLTKKELTKLVKALPKNGYEIIAEKLDGEFTAETIRKYLNDPDRYNVKVVDAAFLVIEEEKVRLASKLEEHKSKIKQLTA